MLVEISIQGLTKRHFEQANFEQRKLAEILAGQINNMTPVFVADDGHYGLGFEFTNYPDKESSDLTLCMALNSVASAHFLSNECVAAEELRRIGQAASISMDLKSGDVNLTLPSLSQK